MFMSVLPHTVTLQALTVTVSAGGKVRAFADRTTGIRCMVNEESGDGEAAQTHAVYFETQAAAAAEIGAGDRIVVTAGPGLSTDKYLSVLGISRLGPVGGISGYTKVSTREVLESWVPDR